MPFDAPIRLGPFTVDAVGRLAPRDPAQAAGFTVRFRGRLVQVGLPPAGRALSVRAVLGRVPSTAGEGAARRATALALLARPDAALPPDWRLHLLADHRLALEASLELALPAGVATLVGTVALLLLELAPYLDELEEAGLDAAGIVNTWPG